MKCPQCGKTLDEIKLGTSRVDRCEECGGIWFDKDELKAVRDERDEELSWLDFDLWSDADQLVAGGTFIDCPRDGSPLYRIGYGPSGVLVDVCPQCHGIWLEMEELGKIQRSLQEKVNRETLPEYMKDLERELEKMIKDPARGKEDIRNISIIMKLMEYRLMAQHPKLAEIIGILPD